MKKPLKNNHLMLMQAFRAGYFALLTLVLSFLLSTALTAQSFDYLGGGGSSSNTEESAPGATGNTAEVEGKNNSDSSVTEEQVKEALLKLLQSDSASQGNSNTEPGEFAYSQNTLDQWEQTTTNTLAYQARELKQLLPNLWSELQKAFLLTTDPDEGFYFWNVITTIAMHILLGLVMEYLATRHLLKRLYRHAKERLQNDESIRVRLRLLMTRIFIQLLGLAVLVISTYLCAIFYIRDNQYFETLFISILTSFIIFRLCILMTRNVFSPYRSYFRLFNLDNTSARILFLWSVLFFSVFFTGDVVLEYLSETQIPPVLIKGLIIPYSFALQLVLISGIWSFRKRITSLFTNNSSNRIAEDVSEATYQHRQHALLASIWPFLITAWILGIWALWLYNIFLDNEKAAANVAIAWWLTMSFPMLDRLFYAIISNVRHISWLQSPTYEKRAKRFTNVLQGGFRLMLLAVAIFTVLSAWGFNTGNMMSESMGSRLVVQLIDVIIICILVYVIWEITQALIEHKLPPQETNALASLEGDGGGAGATRTETLLPLMRTSLTVFLVVFFILSTLHALGIAIGPLLAGAGVIGIAIGFGAQKLVQDILSGIFFLLDDAFRKGEYIEIEDLRGTVENISLRSMQLRHHLGAVQTIPHGEIKTVRNLSRDWVTMKLEIRLPYNTDIEKVRKIIKKVGQSMLEDEIIGKNFILPLKSQGVMRIEESALIVRMKFTCKPGEQWVIRREAFSRVKIALADAGIHFAHREVRVLLPEGMAGPDSLPPNVSPHPPSAPHQPPDDKEGLLDSDYDSVLQKAAAAAATGVIAAEAAKQSKLDEERDFGGDQ